LADEVSERDDAVGYQFRVLDEFRGGFWGVRDSIVKFH
jgi:hypothetical protein